MKVTTVPRHEVSAAVVAFRMSDMLRKELELDDQEFLWTDSKVILGYLNNDGNDGSDFKCLWRIAFRVSRKVQTQISENSDDHAPRVLIAREIISSNWLTGPDFLWHNELHSGRYCS